MKKIIGLSLLLLLTGCGTWRWVNDQGRSNSELPKDKFKCKKESVKMYPVYIVQELERDSSAIQHNQRVKEDIYTHVGKIITDYKNDKTIQTYYPPNTTFLPEHKYVNRDVNFKAREKAYKTCMATKGWYLQHFKS